MVVTGLSLTAALAGAVRQDPIDLGENFLPLTVPDKQDGAFHFCRVRFETAARGDGDGWWVDYPRADRNLSIRLSELTRAHVSFDERRNPRHQLVALTDPRLFTCGFAMMSEPGGAYFSRDEANALRAYLLKGGFLWVDDFWGTAAWDWWDSQIRKVLPASEYPIVDLPMNHPLFHTLFEIDAIPQIPNIGLWTRAHLTSERGRDSAEPHFRAIVDQKSRLMVIMTHNTDFGDAYERESENPDFFRRFSIPGYAIGVNTILYALTH
jgi:hypothetical protein